jgi:hypothetical protein
MAMEEQAGFSESTPEMDGASFIRSICIGLKNAFPEVDLPQTFAEFTKATLDDWLNFLSRRGFRVVIVVDGLDHVDSKHREGVLTNPLTNALDGTLPPGVFMILGVINGSRKSQSDGRSRCSPSSCRDLLPRDTTADYRLSESLAESDAGRHCSISPRRSS